MDFITQKEDGMENMVFWPTRKLCKDMKMQSFHFDESYATRRRKHSSFQMHNVPKCQKHAIPLLQMQASFTTQKHECMYLLCLIMMYTESKYKTFNAPLLSIRRKSPMQMQKTWIKRDTNKACTQGSEGCKKTSRNLLRKTRAP